MKTFTILWTQIQHRQPPKNGKTDVIADTEAQARRIFNNLHPHLKIYRVNPKPASSTK